jgi:ABC-type transport system involved in multi-copper enzyme maturation permease subunit
MLKDSYKEAVDGWIFLVMAVLVGVLVLLVATLSVTPVDPAEALPRMVRGDGPQFIASDRGNGSKLAIFGYQPEVTNIKTEGGADRPWAGPITFDVEFKGSGGFGAAGAEIELDKDKKPKVNEKNIKDAIIVGDPFKEAVRYWAAKPGEKKPDYTDALAVEFVTQQLREATRLNVTKVEKAAPAKGGSLLDVFKSAPAKFTVTADGGEALGWTHRPTLFFGLWTPRFYDRPLGTLVYTLEDTLLNGIGAWVLLLAGVIVTAGFIPNMLRKGAIDLLLTKPLSRPLILLYKYLGGLLFVFLLTVFAVGGVWLMIGLKTGVWAAGLLYAIGGITFYFAILYACSTLVGVLTRNAIVCIVVTIVFWFTVWLIGTIHNGLQVFASLEGGGRPRPQQTRKAEPAKAEDKDKDAKGDKDEPPAEADAPPEPSIPDWVLITSKWANRVTPRTKDLDNLTTKLIAQDLLAPAEMRQATVFLKDLNWGEVLSVAGAWIALFLGLATVRFVTRSY